MKTLKIIKYDVDVRKKIMKPNILLDLLHGIDSTMCKQRTHHIMMKCQSNIASKPATWIYNDKEFAFNVVKSHQVEVVVALQDLSHKKITGHALPTAVTSQNLGKCVSEALH